MPETLPAAVEWLVDGPAGVVEFLDRGRAPFGRVAQRAWATRSPIQSAGVRAGRECSQPLRDGGPLIEGGGERPVECAGRVVEVVRMDRDRSCAQFIKRAGLPATSRAGRRDG